MGMIEAVLGSLFGGGRNVVARTAEVFRENAEAGAARMSSEKAAALSQFAAEFEVPRSGWFDRTMDGVNRLPRPALALGTLGLFVAAMVDPVWFAARMQGIALVPEPLGWLLGVIVSFYFGARHQLKGQQFRRALAESMAQTMARAPQVAQSINAMEGHRAAAPRAAGTGEDADLTLTATRPEANPALQDWRRRRDR